MDTTPIADRLSIIASHINALKELQQTTHEEFLESKILQGAGEYLGKSTH